MENKVSKRAVEIIMGVLLLFPFYGIAGSVFNNNDILFFIMLLFLPNIAAILYLIDNKDYKVSWIFGLIIILFCIGSVELLYLSRITPGLNGMIYDIFFILMIIAEKFMAIIYYSKIVGWTRVGLMFVAIFIILFCFATFMPS